MSCGGPILYVEPFGAMFGLLRCASTMWVGTHLTHLSCAQKSCLLAWHEMLLVWTLHVYWTASMSGLTGQRPPGVDSETGPDRGGSLTVWTQLILATKMQKDAENNRDPNRNLILLQILTKSIKQLVSFRLLRCTQLCERHRTLKQEQSQSKPCHRRFGSFESHLMPLGSFLDSSRSDLPLNLFGSFQLVSFQQPLTLYALQPHGPLSNFPDLARASWCCVSMISWCHCQEIQQQLQKRAEVDLEVDGFICLWLISSDKLKGRPSQFLFPVVFVFTFLYKT